MNADTPTRIALLSGSARRGSTNTAALLSASRDAPAGVVAHLVEGAGALPLFNPDDDQEGVEVDVRVQTLRRQVADADGLLICTPEYGARSPQCSRTCWSGRWETPAPTGSPSRGSTS